MERIISLFESPSCQHLISALLHTLWQGVLIGAILYGILSLIPAQKANRRYACSLAGLCLLLLSGLVTWAILDYRPSPKTEIPFLTPASNEPESIQSISVSPLPDSFIATSTSSATPAKLHRSWYTWAMGTWLLGTGLMLVRMVTTLAGTRQLIQGSHALEDRKLLELIRDLSERMQLKHRVRVLVSPGLSVPGVIGSLWPTLLLPVSMTTGMPVDDLKAILTHELAHIKRYDYLVNLFQMVIEALLFFNPAVWWISRQIRIEREASCDAAGIAATGQRLKYAEVLVAWTASLRTPTIPASAITFSDHEHTGRMADRIKRITQISHRPTLRLSWPIAGLSVLMSLLCLTGLWKGTNLAVATAARILTPQQRIERIHAISKSYGYPPGRNTKDAFLVSGTIQTWDGKPLPKRPSILLDVQSAYHTIKSVGSTPVENQPNQARFQTSLPVGQFWIVASADGYAPISAGPFEVKPGHDIKSIALVLQQGFRGQIQVTDKNGQPIEQASLTGGYTFEQTPSFMNTFDWITNENGMYTLDHSSDQVTMILKITASGYEPQTRQSVVLNPSEPTVIILEEAKPITGTVVSRQTGLPIPNAEIQLLMLKRKNHYSYLKRIESEPDCLTNNEGFFSFDQAQQDCQHLLHITAKGYGHAYLSDVQANTHDIRVELEPQKILRGTILGDLSNLKHDPSGHPMITLENIVKDYNTNPVKAIVTPKDEVGVFEITQVWGQTIVLKAGQQEIKLDPVHDDLDHIVIDLNAVPTREVVLQFDVPDHAPPILGQVRIDRIKERLGAYVHSSYPEWVDINDNQTSFRSPVSGQCSYRMDPYKKMPVGYWFDDSKTLNVPAGTNPLVIHVPVYPAGAIYGKILGPDGTVAKEAKASLLTVKRPDVIKSGFNLTNLLSNKTSLGTYNATPLPLGGTYAIMAYEGYSFAITEPFTLDEAHPTIEANLQLPEGVTVTGCLLDENGNPAINPVFLDITVKNGLSSSGRGGPQTIPDESGQFIFENVNPGPGGICKIRVTGQSGYRPIRKTIDDITQPVVIQLEKGHTLTGTVIDQDTGWPVPGVEVYAQSAKNARGDYSDTWELLEAEAKTDSTGRFEFTNMDTCFYRLGVRGANLASRHQPIVITGGQRATVTLQVECLPWSDVKPRQPE